MKSLLVTLLMALLTVTAHAGDWTLKKDEDGIRIYVRNMEGSKFRSFRGVTDMVTTLHALMAVHKDGTMAKQWLKDCEKAEFITEFDPKGYSMYFRTKAPWPVKDRDYALRYTLAQDPVTRTLVLQFTGDADLVPEQKDCVRMSKIDGIWRMTPTGAGLVHVEYEVHADPNGDLPAWLANQFVVDQPFHTLKKLRKQVLLPQYQSQHFDFIKD